MRESRVIIIGAGPAGVAAAIQLKRYGIEPLLIEKEDVGGLLKNANLVENYPGFPQGVTGPELVRLLKEHLKRAGFEPVYEEVVRVDFTEDSFIVETPKRSYASATVVVATGTKPKRPGEILLKEGAEDLTFYEVHPLLHLRDGRVAIVGAGDAAFDYALNLSRRNSVLILNRGVEAKCLPLLFKRAMERREITYHPDTHIRSVEKVEGGLRLSCQVGGRERDIYATHLLFATGREPCLDFMSDRLKKGLRMGEVIKGLYLIGDVKNGIYRQAAIAAGDGIRVAMEIYMMEKEGRSHEGHGKDRQR
ncbi:MAG: hypothetical protein DRN40_02600 [Thermoplasmata archaeon]|nr:MAG: hypothetical protein DRN40_02600 [Thermoplasmata archaeon]